MKKIKKILLFLTSDKLNSSFNKFKCDLKKRLLIHFEWIAIAFLIRAFKLRKPWSEKRWWENRKQVNLVKELSLCHKLLFIIPISFAIWWWKPLIFQICVMLWNRIYSLKYLRSTTLESKDIGIRKSEFVAKTFV